MKKQPDSGMDAVHTRLDVALQTTEEYGPWAVARIMAECVDANCKQCDAILVKHGITPPPASADVEMAVRVVDMFGRERTVDNADVARVTRPSAAAAARGVGCFVHLVDGNIIETRATVSQVAKQLPGGGE